MITPPLPDGPGSYLLVNGAWVLQEATAAEAVPGELERARDDQGRFVADDPTTPQDEAWIPALAD